MKSQHKYVSTREAAEFLGLAPGTLRNYRSDGIGPVYYRVSGSRVVYAVEELNAYVEAGRVEPLSVLRKAVAA